MGGNDWQENLKILAEVLDRLQQYNLRLKLSKCEFLKPEVVYLGLKISAVGLKPVKQKINAVTKAPTPRNVSELKSFLGMVQYYHSFMPRLATTLASRALTPSERNYAQIEREALSIVYGVQSSVFVQTKGRVNK